MDYSEAELQAFRWQQSYDAIEALLPRHGIENAFGEGDFWLVDDNYGTPQHKLVIFRLGALTQGLVRDLQAVLRAPALTGWSIMVALDLPPVDAEAVPPEGLIVSSDTVVEHWDTQRLRDRFGADFHWPAGQEPDAAPDGRPAPDIAATPDPAFHAAWMEGQAAWQRQHDALVALLEAHAGQAMSPHADFYVAAEPDERSHLLVLRDIRLATRVLADSLSALLRSEPWWGQTVMLALDLQSPDGQALPREAVIISGDMVMAAYHAKQLKEVFGDSFDWSNAIEDLD